MLDRQFERIWIVSLGDGVVDTWSGFEVHCSVSLDDSGVLASSLEELGTRPDQGARGTEPVGKPPNMLAAEGLLLAMAWIGGLGLRRLVRSPPPETPR